MNSKIKPPTTQSFEFSNSYDNPEEPPEASMYDETHPIVIHHQVTEMSTDTENTRSYYTMSTKSDYQTYGSSGVDIAMGPRQRKRFGHLSASAVVLVQIIGLCSIGVTFYKVYEFHNGLGWDGGEKEFNFHSVFMVIGLVFCYANVALSSYVFNNKKESIVHYMHGISILLTFVFTVFGMVPTFLTNFKGEKKNGFHTWLGSITLLFFGVQAFIGFVGLFPKCDYHIRKRYLKFQLWIAILVFILSITTCLLGFIERSYSVMNGSYHIIGINLITNISCLILVIFGIIVTSVLLHPIYRQVTRPE